VLIGYTQNSKKGFSHCSFLAFF